MVAMPCSNLSGSCSRSSGEAEISDEERTPRMAMVDDRRPNMGLEDGDDKEEDDDVDEEDDDEDFEEGGEDEAELEDELEEEAADGGKANTECFDESKGN